MVAEEETLRARIRELEGQLNAPEIADFTTGVQREVAHQRQRWAAHDEVKSHADWFWLVGYLGGKALHAAISGDRPKALHHTISAAAALAQWHQAILAEKR